MISLSRPSAKIGGFFMPEMLKMHQRNKKVTQKFAGTEKSTYLCQRVKDSGNPLGRAHVRRSATMPGIFYAQLATDKTAAIP